MLQSLYEINHLLTICESMIKEIAKYESEDPYIRHMQRIMIFNLIDYKKKLKKEYDILGDIEI